MKNKVYLAIRITLIVLIICTLIFTFYQSMLPKEESAEASEGVSDFLEPIIPSDTPTGEFVHSNIREIAHFTEFFFLGLFVSLYVVIFLPRIDCKAGERVRFVVYSVIISPIIPLLDETVQIFSNRGPEILDVWLDIAGYLAASLIVNSIFFAVKYVMRRRTARNNNTAH